MIENEGPPMALLGSVAELAAIAARHPGRPLALLCFENVHVGQSRHGRWLAEWLDVWFDLDATEGRPACSDQWRRGLVAAALLRGALTALRRVRLDPSAWKAGLHLGPGSLVTSADCDTHSGAGRVVEQPQDGL